jgi:hypothetical protein
MVDSVFQGFGASAGGTHQAVLSSAEYLSQVGLASPAKYLKGIAGKLTQLSSESYQVTGSP